MSRPLVVITGAAGSLGRVVAQTFADHARLVLLDINEQALVNAFGPARDGLQLIAVDLTHAAAVDDALKPLLEREGPVAVLCNLAGGFDMGPAVHETSDQAWRQLLDLNVSSVLNACRSIVPGMLAAGDGKVINVAAAGAATGTAHKGAYCASKSAVARLTESMALELRSQGINVNAISPSIIDTPANRAAMPDANPAHWVSPQDLADIIQFLASPQAKAIHGAVIPVVGLS